MTAAIRDRLKQRRKALGWDTDELGQRVGASARTVQRWEAGTREPGEKMLHRWAARLGCRIVVEVCEPEENGLATESVGEIMIDQA